MAARLDHLLSYGPMDVVASNDEKNPGLYIVHMDAENRAFIPQDDQLHREIRNLIEKNPHSKGFVANQIHARLEQEGRWDGPGLHPAKGHDAEGLSFSQSMNPEQEKGEALNFHENDLLPLLESVHRAEARLPQWEDRAAAGEAAVAAERTRLLLQDGEIGEALAFLDDAITLETLEPGEEHSFATAKARIETAWADWRERHGLSENVLPRTYPMTREMGPDAQDAPLASKDAALPLDLLSDQEPQQKTMTEPDPLADWPGTSQKSPEPLLPPEKSRFERKNPPEVLFANPKGKPYVLDHGDKVTVTNRAMLGLGHEAAEKRRKAVEIGLKAAVDRFGEPVRFQGNRAFLEETVKVALERGIALEPGSPMARDIYERAIKERGNQFGPSNDVAPYRAPEKKREVDKGKGIGL